MSTDAQPQRGPNWTAGNTSPTMLRAATARRLNDGRGRATGAALGRGRAEQQSHGRSRLPAPALASPTSTAHQPEGFRGDSWKSQDRPPRPAELGLEEELAPPTSARADGERSSRAPAGNRAPRQERSRPQVSYCITLCRADHSLARYVLLVYRN